MRLASQLNRIFIVAISTSIIITFGFYFILSNAHKHQVIASAKQRLNGLIDGQLPLLVQEFVNDKFYAALMRGQSIVKENKDLEIGLYRKDGSAIYESNKAKEIFRSHFEQSKSDFLENGFVVVSRQISILREGLGTIFFAQPVDLSMASFLKSSLLFALCILLFSLLFLFMTSRTLLSKSVVKPIMELTGAIPNIREYLRGMTDSVNIPTSLGSTELNQVAETIHMVSKDLKKALLREYEIQLKTEKYVAIEQISAQVAHDIRSPLAALNILVRHIEAIPEGERILLRNSVKRIQDIANNLSLMKQEKKDADNISVQAHKISIELLPSLLESIVSEKRTQYRDRWGISIEDQCDQSSYGAFVEIEPVEFKRMISNIINNAVEACHEEGKVVLTVSAEDTKILLTIEDNGRGIPQNIIAKVCDHNFSFGKAGGSGLGLFHAKETMKRWGGDITIDSEEGQGTTLKLSFKRAKAPVWFLPKLTIFPNTMMLILDDDTSIHEVWKRRFRESDFTRYNVMHMHFTSAKALSFLLENQKWESYYLLSDYELLGEQETGLDLIERLNIGKHSILVTSHFEEERIRTRCELLGVSLLPKGLAGSVPIEILPHSLFEEESERREDSIHESV